MTPVIVYPIKESPTKDEDLLLKYSLRSLEKNGGKFSKIYMIGKRRDWFARNVQMCDIASNKKGGGKFMNVGLKMRVFCGTKMPFVLMNDDFIICKKMQITKIKNKALPSVKRIIDNHRSQGYKGMLQRTIEKINDGNDMPAFITHTPMLIDQPELMERYEQKFLYVSFRQAYAVLRNLAEDPGTVMVEKDVKFKNPMKPHQWIEIMRKNETISLHPAAVDKRLFTALEEMFPDKSKYEK